MAGVLGTFGTVSLVSLALLGCSGFKTRLDQGSSDGPLLDVASDHGADRSRRDGPRAEQGSSDVGPLASCRPLALACLDPSASTVIEVPSELTAAQAFAAAKSGDTIQIRGLSLGAGWAVPPYVTLRGCDGAKIAGGIRFSGSGGVVEGFEVAGQIVANATGSYVIRYNRFGGTGSEAAVSARSIDGLVSASVTAVVESNWFEQRPAGVEGSTKYDTGTHSVDLTVRNNVFTGVASPIVLSEGGLVGKIKARIEHNTLHGFTTGIAAYGLDDKLVLSGNILASGDTGIAFSSAYELIFCLGWQLKTTYTTPPLSGALANGDPVFVDASKGDFRLGPASTAIDKVAAGTVVPAEDYLGCPRPVAYSGAEAKADIGAFEAQR
jgi:hypothetical protein